MLQEKADFTSVLLDPVILAGLVAIAGGIALRWFLRGHPAHGVMLRLGFLIAVTVIAIKSGNAPYEPAPTGVSPLHRAFIGATKLVWWTTAAWFMAACVRVFLRFEGQARESRVIQDLIVGIIYVGAVLSIIAYVFGAPVGTLLATSGVVAIILGLALQSTLNDLFSGIALNIGQPYAIGDWIALPDGTQGRVTEMNWRATHLLNGTNDLVVLPNAQLAKLMVTNRSSSERSHGATLTLRFVPTRRPTLIAEAMQNALLNSTAILQTPPPGVQITALDADAVTLELSFRVAEFSRIARTKSELFDLVYRHAKAGDLRLASHEGSGGTGGGTLEAARPTPLRLTETLPLFSSLSGDEKERIASSMTRRAYRKGEIVAARGDILSSLLILRSGIVSVEDASGIELRLAPGDYIGESGMLMKAAETATFRALTNVVMYEVDRETMAQLLEERPGIAEELALHLSQRAAKLGGTDAGIAASSATRQGIVTRLVDQIMMALKSSA
ncbi:mechanosensitive ion channel family protein [Agrobacterium sp. B1(2019)]|uniref:cyclic nucleotide-binding domain-containing protein n=1 Tax=Agrobacterium sp. B1(2019) TaxID=2607032 RepID=UPI0011ECB43F|nr:mechanosensitive ion channel family protein [Agrobacterium sp. B1(2019)]TZG36038.1 mechanosensitive ion channel [Agrobacterium sp. B1(2019)]